MTKSYLIIFLLLFSNSLLAQVDSRVKGHIKKRKKIERYFLVCNSCITPKYLCFVVINDDGFRNQL